MQLYTAILAGGIGTRLWPRSRKSHPKQFSDIIGAGQTMIQTTVRRLSDMVENDRIFVVTGAEYAALIAQQLPQLPKENVLAEPDGRNTAPAIGLACVHLLQRDPDAVAAFLHADHVMLDEDAFRAALARAAVAAESGYLVTLGVEPGFAHTGYGYIQRSSPIVDAGPGELPVYAVDRFLEKPDRATAETFLATGGYYWNGGIFVCRVDHMLAEMARQLPEVYTCLQEIAAGFDSARPAEVMASAWAKMPNISIDHGIMEHAENVAVVPLDAGWTDVGSWDALEEVLTPDINGNYSARSDIIAVDSSENIVYCEQRPVALVGVEDLVVVDTGDVLLVGRRDKMQLVKDVVAQLREQGRSDLL